ncbi:reelin-like [Macrobrachium nipponense]|uniref:reelin-like n=1 Tax=Macrobrachium nipponense TaxID=159736 RepID=UPI0030C86C77
MTSGQFIQFNLQMGCKKPAIHQSKHSAETRMESDFIPPSEETSSYRLHSILVQYSTNGGIVWHMLKEIHYQETSRPISISINLGDFPDVQQNATRFRLWQPRHEGVMMQAWAIDNIFIGGMPVTPNVLYEDFNKGSPMEDVWTDWPAGEVGVLCDKSDSNSGLILRNGGGRTCRLYQRYCSR